MTQGKQTDTKKDQNTHAPEKTAKETATELPVAAAEAHYFTSSAPPPAIKPGHILALQRTIGNRATMNTLAKKQSQVLPVGNNKSTNPMIQRKLPSSVGMFSLDSLAEQYNALIQRIANEVNPAAKRAGDLALLLKGSEVTAEIDTEVMQEAKAKIKAISGLPGTQNLEATTEGYLKAAEDLDQTPTPDAELKALEAASLELEVAVTEQEKDQTEQESEKSEAELAKEKAEIKSKAELVGMGIENGLKFIRAMVKGGQGIDDVAINIAKIGSTKLTEWMLQSDDKLQNMETKLKEAKEKVGALRTMVAVKKAEAAERKRASAQSIYDEKLREIFNKIKKLQRAEADLETELRNVGLAEAAGAIKSSAAARRTAGEMLIALDAYEAAVTAVLPEASAVFNNFDQLENALDSPGTALTSDESQRLELINFCTQGKHPRQLLNQQLGIIQKNRQLIQSGHYNNIYQPVQDILHETQI